ncbi:hypothetical protein SS50377_22545 [Spironucleus salmonicida]|uniref:Uncharacterized protein n=1 Tax=Spironucleus salmonicida TaxID=348837 RepID=V6LML8_9EUKA|nr:hypothetical protein SS50377_22545 [Spironucleus salmonicida]|eukprot:EST41964.1 Hypothetical protein SS50377_18269 [Spironucleus salmonicida]
MTSSEFNPTLPIPCKKVFFDQDAIKSTWILVAWANYQSKYHIQKFHIQALAHEASMATILFVVLHRILSQTHSTYYLWFYAKLVEQQDQRILIGAEIIVTPCMRLEVISISGSSFRINRNIDFEDVASCGQLSRQVALTVSPLTSETVLFDRQRLPILILIIRKQNFTVI